MKYLYLFSIIVVFAACKKKDSPPILNSSGSGSGANSKFVGNYSGVLTTEWGTDETVLTVEKGNSSSKINMFFDLNQNDVYEAYVDGFMFSLIPKEQQDGIYTLSTTGQGELAEDESYISLEMEQVYYEGGIQMTSPTTMWFYGTK